MRVVLLLLLRCSLWDSYCFKFRALGFLLLTVYCFVWVLEFLCFTFGLLIYWTLLPPNRRLLLNILKRFTNVSGLGNAKSRNNRVLTKKFVCPFGFIILSTWIVLVLFSRAFAAWSWLCARNKSDFKVLVKISEFLTTGGGKLQRIPKRRNNQNVNSL